MLKILVAGLAMTVLGASACAVWSAEDPRFIFRHKASRVAAGGPVIPGNPGGGNPGGGGSGPGGPGTPGDGGSGGIPGDGSGGNGPGAGDSDSGGTDPETAAHYKLVWFYVGDDYYIDPAYQQRQPNFISLPTSPFRLGDTVKICFETPGVYNTPSYRMQLQGGDHITGASLEGQGDIQSFDMTGYPSDPPQDFEAAGDLGCLNLRTGVTRAPQDPGILAVQVFAKSDSYRYYGEVDQWGSPYEFDRSYWFETNRFAVARFERVD